MRKLIYFASVALLFPLINAFTDSAYCEEIKICPNFKEERVTDDELPSNASRWSGETEVAKNGSWEGVVPEKYKLDLNFVNVTHYTGSVDITLRLHWPTSRIIINHGKINPSIDYRAITIRKACGMKNSPFRKRSADAYGTRCIEKATFLEINETLVLDLLGTLEFNPGIRYVISFPKFHGRTGNEAGTLGGRGLHESTVQDAQSITDFSALSTIFQMRYARTAFPCFDHPALKARFDLSIERPAHISVASNRPSVESTAIGSNRKRDRFGLTPVISTYVFTFALMENFTSESKPVPGSGTRIEIFAPIGTMDRFRWMFDETIAVVQYFERITKFKFPLERLGFLVVYPAPFWGVENLGLVTVEGAFMESPTSTETAYTILYHEIVHQWLGDVVTISEWKEICLQEGLTAYFEWKISADRRNGSLDRKARQVRAQKDHDSYYEPYALREYRKTQDIADWCYGRPSVFFHAVTKRYGFEALERFLARLIEKRSYGTADIRVWDKTLEEVTRGRTNTMKGYIETWFLQPGPLYLLISRQAQSNCIVIRQSVAQPNGSPVQPAIARQIPLSITTKSVSSKASIDIFVAALEEKVCDVGDLYIVDPDGDTLTRKAYTAEQYLDILPLQNGVQTAFSEGQLKEFVFNFCKVFLDDVLPIADEPASTKATDWLQVYSLVKNSSAISVASTCSCCLRSKEENSEIRPCMRQWNAYCKGLRLNKIVGYNYSISREESWG